MARIKGIIFDLWNTLMHSSLYHQTYDLIGCVMRIPELGEDKENEFHHMMLTQHFHSLEYLLGSLHEKTQQPLPSHEDVQRIRSYLEEELASTRLYEETVPVLQELKKMKLKVALLSNISSLYLPAVIRRNLVPYFFPRGFSCLIGFQKPEPQSYHWVLNALHLEPREVLMVGDSLQNDVLMPRNLGIEAYHLNRGQTSFYPYTIRSLEEVFNILEADLE